MPATTTTAFKRPIAADYEVEEQYKQRRQQSPQQQQQHHSHQQQLRPFVQDEDEEVDEDEDHYAQQQQQQQADDEMDEGDSGFAEPQDLPSPGSQTKSQQQKAAKTPSSDEDGQTRYDTEQAVSEITTGFEADLVRLDEHHERIVEAVDALFHRLREEMEAQQAERSTEYQARLNEIVQAEDKQAQLRERLARFRQLLQDNFVSLLGE